MEVYEIAYCFTVLLYVSEKLLENFLFNKRNEEKSFRFYIATILLGNF